MAQYLAQPYDSGLSAISELSTSSFGRILLTLQSSAAVRQYIGAISAGDNTIGDFPVILTSAQENDTLQFKSWAWKNIPQEALTDGGNF